MDFTIEVVVLVVRVSEVLPRIDLHSDVSEVAIPSVCLRIDPKELLDVRVIGLRVPVVATKER